MATVQQSTTATAQGPIAHYDAVIIGAGVGGLYALHHLRKWASQSVSTTEPPA